MSTTQTILGSGGAIGTELANILSNYTQHVRLVSRNPQRVNPADELFPADLSDPEQVIKAVEESAVVYITVGFDYNAKVWKEKWVPFIKSAIEACVRNQCKMVFFDNVYAIGGDNVRHITENTPISPTSKKGEVRAEVNKLILEAIEKRNLNAIIARAPDFFSEIKDRSLLMNLVYNNLAEGKKAQWFCNAKVVHSCGYAPELAKGTAMLGNKLEAYNQIWNLPVDPERITGEQWINLFAEAMHTSNAYQVLPGWGMRALGLFIPILREMYEMRYQYDRDYYFDSSKFNNTFGYKPITHAEAVKNTVEKLRKNDL